MFFLASRSLIGFLSSVVSFLFLSPLPLCIPPWFLVVLFLLRFPSLYHHHHHPSFRAVFYLSIVCVPGCVSFLTALFLLTFCLVSLASGISCLPLASFAAFLFLLGFFCSFPVSSLVLSPTSSGGVPWLVLALLSVTSPSMLCFLFSYIS